eukprot:TRINITY_DN32289_c1_g1_i1.p1 TRINITY_DN32289_c1_g1~~TRINITY_DN32289_c1_g1_i1.p1  ORF type:complete len:264 (-),score=-21.32 TRINITY_DN32289_c1_g1_i1:61-822(-)
MNGQVLGWSECGKEDEQSKLPVNKRSIAKCIQDLYWQLQNSYKIKSSLDTKNTKITLILVFFAYCIYISQIISSIVSIYHKLFQVNILFIYIRLQKNRIWTKNNYVLQTNVTPIWINVKVQKITNSKNKSRVRITENIQGKCILWDMGYYEHFELVRTLNQPSSNQRESTVQQFELTIRSQIRDLFKDYKYSRIPHNQYLKVRRVARQYSLKNNSSYKLPQFEIKIKSRLHLIYYCASRTITSSSICIKLGVL